MCGILGQVSYKSSTDITLNLDSIAHRGPDGNGQWENDKGTVYFGHTRLAIIDPSPTGKQPMQDSTGRFTITFNGEIYNHQSLRRLLPAIQWRGNSDTETLVELFAAQNMASLPLLKGMFAFAIHDAKDDSVLLVRDRLGIKPLWIKQTKSSYSFSSEVRSLIAQGRFVPNQLFLNEYIGFGRLPGTGAIIKGIESLSPGGWVRISAHGRIEKSIWWPKPPLTRTISKDFE